MSNTKTLFTFLRRYKERVRKVESEFALMVDARAEDVADIDLLFGMAENMEDYLIQLCEYLDTTLPNVPIFREYSTDDGPTRHSQEKADEALASDADEGDAETIDEQQKILSFDFTREPKNCAHSVRNWAKTYSYCGYAAAYADTQETDKVPDCTECQYFSARYQELPAHKPQKKTKEEVLAVTAVVEL